MTDSTIGFIGLGTMGMPMAGHLARSGRRVIGYDVDPAKRDAFATASGAPAASAPGDLAEATAIVTMLPTGAVVRSALLDGGEASLARRLAPGSLVVDCTSSPPAATRDLGAILAERGVTLVDAPVSGGVWGAEAADLVFMLGSDDDSAAIRAETILSVMGKRIFRLGPLGAGDMMKSLNNYVAAASFIAACEAVAVGVEHGLQAKAMVDVLNVSAGRSFATETSMRRIVDGDFARYFALDLFTKDLKIAADLAEASGVVTPLADLVHARMAEARDALNPSDDHATAFPYWAAQKRTRRDEAAE